MIYWEERQNAYFIHANASKNETIKNRVEGNMSKKFLFRKFKWYIGRKMKNVLGNGFWPKYFAYIIPVNPHSSPRWVVLLLPLYKERYNISEALKMPWLFSKGPHPDSNSEEPDCKVPERRKWGLSLYMERSHWYLCQKPAHRWSRPRAIFKDFHKCHNLNNSNIQN